MNEDFSVPDGIKLISLVDDPAIEAMDYFQSRFARPNCTYYKIVEEGHTVGLVRTMVAEDADQGWLGLIGIDPDHRGKGYGHKAMLELESLYPTSYPLGALYRLTGA